MDKSERTKQLVEQGLWAAQAKVLAERWEQVAKRARAIPPAERSKKILLVAANGVDVEERAAYVAMVMKKTGARAEGSASSSHFTADVMAETPEDGVRLAVLDREGIVQIWTMDVRS